MDSFNSITFAEETCAVEFENFSLNFIEDVQYEFIGGGTAVNNL